MFLFRKVSTQSQKRDQFFSNDETPSEQFAIDHVTRWMIKKNLRGGGGDTHVAVTLTTMQNTVVGWMDRENFRRL